MNLKTVYQSSFDTSELKKDKSTEYLFSEKSKVVFNSKLQSLYTAFLHSITPSEYRMGINFDKGPSAI